MKRYIFFKAKWCVSWEVESLKSKIQRDSFSLSEFESLFFDGRYTNAMISYTKTFSAGQLYVYRWMYTVISKRVHQAISSKTKQYFWNCILLHRATENKSPSPVFAYIYFALYKKLILKKLISTGKKSWELIFKRNCSSYVKILESQVLHIETRRLPYSKLFLSYIIAWNSLIMFIL